MRTSDKQLAEVKEDIFVKEEDIPYENIARALRQAIIDCQRRPTKPFRIFDALCTRPDKFAFDERLNYTEAIWAKGIGDIILRVREQYKNTGGTVADFSKGSIIQVVTEPVTRGKEPSINFQANLGAHGRILKKVRIQRPRDSTIHHLPRTAVLEQFYNVYPSRLNSINFCFLPSDVDEQQQVQPVELSIGKLCCRTDNGIENRVNWEPDDPRVILNRGSNIGHSGDLVYFLTAEKVAEEDKRGVLKLDLHGLTFPRASDKPIEPAESHEVGRISDRVPLVLKPEDITAGIISVLKEKPLGDLAIIQ